MNRKKKQVLFALVVAVILILLWHFRPRSSSPSVEAEQVPPMQTNEPVSVRQPVQQSQVSSTPAANTAPPPQLSSQASVAAQRKAEMMENKLLWRTPIVFFGKVVDESNHPIAGVHVSFGANTADEQLTKEVRNEGATTSDARGIFEISGITGRSFVLELSHPGYYSSSTNPPGYDYADELRTGNGVPDTEDKAMLFYMHHKGNPVALIDRRGGLHKPADGTTMDFPLRGKTQGEIIGQLQAQAWKGEPDPQNDNHYDWKVKITVPGGGVMASSNEFGFIAPESGYQQTLEIGMSKDDPNWKPGVNEKLFFKLPNYFARGQADIDLYHDFYFVMHYFVNPDGSPNLEPAN